MNPNPHTDSPGLDPSAADAPDAARRRAILRGLGKGGAVLTAAAPMTSFAVGRVKTGDGKQCTVSGQMSAVMSTAASQNACAAFHPTHFFNAETVSISTLPQTLQNDINAANAGAYVWRADAGYFKAPASTGTVRKLTPANRPSPALADVDLKVSGILSDFTPAGRRVLRELHSNSEGEAAYFLAAYFSAYLLAPQNSEKVPFTAADVQSHFGAATQPDAFALYKLVCIVGKDTSKLG